MKHIETEFEIVKSILTETDDCDEGLESLKFINDEYIQLLGRVETLEKRRDELIDQIEELEDDKEDIEKINLFRDPSNWQGDRFLPVLNYLRSDSPFELLG